MPQPRTCHLLHMGSNVGDGLWSGAAAEGWVAPEHWIYRSTVQGLQGIVAPLFSTLVQAVMDLHGQAHSSVTGTLKLAKQITFQEKILCRNRFPDLTMGMDCFDILQKYLKQDGKPFENTSFCTVTKFKVVALYFQKYLQTIKGLLSGDTENLWYSKISTEVAKTKKFQD